MSGACSLLRGGGWAFLLAVCATAQLEGQCPDGTPPPCAPRLAVAQAVPFSVAVLYFENLSRDTTDAYLADGLTEEITSRLGNIRRLEVKSRNAVRPFRGEAAADLAAVGRRLRVRYLVEGSVRRGGARVRVSARLIRADNGFRVWGADFDRSTGDLLALQEEIAAEVATNIAGQLLPEERARLAARPTRNADAYDHFLRGNYYLAFRAPGPAVRAAEEYDAAIRLDPAFSAALARSSLTYALTLDWGWPFPALSTDSLVARAAAAAARAVRLDSGSADAWMAEAFALSHEHPLSYQGVIEAIERAVALDPRNAEVWHQYGWFLYVLGRPNDALAALQRALAIEPARAISCEHISRVLFVERRYDEARRWIDSAIVLDPAQSYYYLQRTTILLALGDTAGARRDAETSARLGVDYPFSGATARAYVALATGDTGAAPTLERQLLAASRDPRHLSLVEAFGIAGILARAGRTDAALSYLENAQPRSVILWSWLNGAVFDPLRAEPRFQRLLEELRPTRAPR
jgi:adenylate cyclase